MVVVEHIVAEAADLGQVTVPLHQVRLDVELEALLRSRLLVEPAEYKHMLRVNRHAHGQVASCPRGLGVQVNHAPHVVVDVVHLDRVGDLLLVKLRAAGEHVDVLVGEDAACG